MRDGQSVQDHCLMMIKSLEELEKLKMRLDLDLQNDIILQSLTLYRKMSASNPLARILDTQTDWTQLKRLAQELQNCFGFREVNTCFGPGPSHLTSSSIH